MSQSPDREGEEKQPAFNIQTMLRKIFLVSGGIILASTSLAKLYSTFGSARILDVSDQLLLVPNRFILLALGAVELGVVCLLLLGRNDRIKLLSLLWLSSMFGSYRAAKWYFGIRQPCSCLGSLTEKLPFKPHTIDLGMQFIVAYLFLGSLLLLLSAWFQQRRITGVGLLAGTRRMEA